MELRPVARLRATVFRAYRSSFAAASTLCSVSGFILWVPFNTYDTAAMETPARSATSFIVAIGPRLTATANSVKGTNEAIQSTVRGTVVSIARIE